MKRLFILMFFLLASTALNAQITREKQTETDGFVWILVIDESDDDDDFYGAEDKNGKTIISYKKKYTDIDYDEGYFIVEDRKGYEGVIDKKGKVIIPTSRRYDSIMYFDNCFYADKDGDEYICDVKTGKELGKNTKITSSYKAAYNAAKSANSSTQTNTSTSTKTYSSTPNNTSGGKPIKRTKMSESDGFIWYRIQYEGDYSAYGAEDNNGKTLIPISKGYSSIYYYNGSFGVEKNRVQGAYNKYGVEVISTDRGYDKVVRHDRHFGVKKNGKEGACDLQGNEVISPNRGYDRVVRQETYFAITKNGREGACDISGKEVVAPNYSALICVDGVYKYRDAGGSWQPVSSSSTSSYSSSSSYKSSSTSSSTGSSYSGSRSGNTSSGNGRMLYSGIYTFTGMFVDQTGITSTGFTELCNITVYENSMTVERDGTKPYIGNATVYGVSGRAYGDQSNYYIVTDAGVVTKVMTQTNFVPLVGNYTQTVMFYYDIGDTRSLYAGRQISPNNGGSNYGGSSSYGGSTGTSQRSQQSCRTCYGTGLCKTCNGSGWVTNPYTSKNSPCSSCNDKYGTGPNRGKCWTCHGTGKK